MADFDLFDMVGLSFDPLETNARAVKRKIEQKKAELGSALGRATQQTDRDLIQSQIIFLENIVKIILTSDGKKIIDSELKSLADKKTTAELESLTATIALLSLTGGHTVTESTIRHYKKESRLSVEHVKKAFTDAGFEIINKDPLAAFPKFPTNAERIYAELATLRQTKDPNPNGEDTSVITDLYAFAAYICSDVSNVVQYRSMTTSELLDIFNSASRRYSQRNDDLGKLCGSLSAAAKTYVFNSDDNRVAYEKHLLYKSNELTKLFSTMKRAPESALLDPKFAEPCIEVICNYFTEYEVALAIYNKEAGFTDRFYCPLSWRYTIKCGFCDHVNTFPGEADAQKANICENCKKELFKKCTKCGKLVPYSKEVCPYCKYVFASAALFSKYFQQAEAAFRKGEFDFARKCLFQAQTAAPGEKSRIDQLSRQIDKQEVAYKEPINRLRQLIAERKFQAARAELSLTIKKYPALNISEFEQTVRTELLKADSLFAAVANSSASKKADVCVTILMQCSDYAPAIGFLRTTAPLPCDIIRVSPVSESGVINVSWSRSMEQGVSYRLLRKIGNKASISENDGSILLDDSTTTSFTDESVKPGQVYCYSVFTSRFQVFSKPTSDEGILYSDVKNCHVFQRGSVIRITWDSPQNSRGVTLFRICDGEKVVLTETGHGSYEDPDVQYGKTYTYIICANYNDGRKSPGIERVITPLIMIDSFSIRANKVKDNIYKITWSIRSCEVDLRIMVNDRLTAEVKSNESFTQISLPRETFCIIKVLAYSGGKWISSDNRIEVNTYTSCGIDKKATRMEEKRISGRNGLIYRIDLRICLSGKIPSNVIGFYYSVRTTKSSTRWASLDDIGTTSDIQKVSIATYQRQGAILFQDFVLNETAFFVSVFTIYTSGGKEIVSEPQKVKIDRPLLANLFWSVSYGMFDGLRLSIEINGNRPIDYIPELILCVCEDDQFLVSHDDNNSQIIMDIPSTDLDKPQTDYKKIYIVKTDLSLRYIKRCRFFLFEKETISGDNITLRWKQGFLGKV